MDIYICGEDQTYRCGVENKIYILLENLVSYSFIE